MRNVVVRSVGELLEAEGKIPRDNSGPAFRLYRGQQQDWPLYPKLFRLAMAKINYQNDEGLTVPLYY